MESNDGFSSPTNRVAKSYRAKRDATSAQLPDLGLGGNKSSFSFSHPHSHNHRPGLNRTGTNNTNADVSDAVLHADSSARIRQKAQAFSSQMEKASLERRLLAAEAEKKELEVRMTQKERLVAKLESDRRWLADREKEEREEKEEERKEREEEKRTSATTIRNLRVELSTLRDELAELQDAHSTLKRTTSHTINSQKTHLVELTRQAAVLDEELATARHLTEEHQHNAQALRTQLEELTLEKDTAAPRGAEDDASWRVVREELHRQVSHMRTLETTNTQLMGELASLRERYTSVEVLREEKRDLERRARGAEELRERVAKLEAELEAGRVEREQWAQMQQRGDGGREAAPSVSVSQGLAELRLKNALLQEEHGAVTAALRRREVELEEATRKGTEADEFVARLESDLKELRYHGARRDGRLELAEREVGFLKALVASFDAEESVASELDGARLQRIQNLEEVVEKLKADNDLLEQEVLTLGGGMRHGTSWTELTRSFEEEQARRKALEQEITEAQTVNTKTLEKVEELEQTLFELRGDIASGSHVPPTVRVLSLRDNPAQNWTDLRQEVMDRLRNENDALLRRLQELEVAGVREGHWDSEAGVESGKEHLVPRESWEKEHKERCDLEEAVKQKEKRLLRLQQVFSSKAQEFRDTMSSILGFKVHFFSNGQVKVTSQYDVNTSFVFQPVTSKKEDDDEGTRMQLVGAGDSGLPDLARTVDYWVKQRMCIPGLMASVTLECYDKTKRGQAQAWKVSA